MATGVAEVATERQPTAKVVTKVTIESALSQINDGVPRYQSTPKTAGAMSPFGTISKSSPLRTSFACPVSSPPENSDSGTVYHILQFNRLEITTLGGNRNPFHTSGVAITE